MRGKNIDSFNTYGKQFILTMSVIILAAAAVCAQASSGAATASTATKQPAATTTQSPGSVAQSVSASNAGTGETTRKRIERARALAAAHQLSSAAGELESIRAQVKDDVVRNLASVMLIGIYLEDGNYARAESLLEEAFKECSSQHEVAVRVYFALAGQAVNGARSHVARYRTFGLDIGNAELPAEATGDLDRLRSFLERVLAQAKDLMKANAKNYDVLALIEDVAGIRATLACDSRDRARWESEYAAAREKLATSQMQIASISGIASLGAAFPTTRSAASTTEPSVDGTESVNNSSSGAATTETPSAREPENKPLATATQGTKASTSSVLEVGSLAEKAVKTVVPTYPQIAKNAGASGLVRVKIVVDESGSVANVVWAEGPLLLRPAAQDAARQFKFQPTMVDGKPVRVAGYIDFGFSR